MKKVFALMLAAVMVFALVACGSEGSSDTAKEITDVAVYEDTQADILDAEFFTTEDGISAVRVNFKYTNNSADGLYMYESFAVHAFQNDVELNEITDINEEPEVGNSAELIREIKDGASLEGSYVFALSDDSDVEVRVFTPTADEELLAQKVFSK